VARTTTLDAPLVPIQLQAAITVAASIVRALRASASGKPQLPLNWCQYVTLDDPLATGNTNAHGITTRAGSLRDYFLTTQWPRARLPLQPARRHLHQPSMIPRRASQAPLQPGINNAGQIVGYYFDNADKRLHGFLFNPNRRTYNHPR